MELAGKRVLVVGLGGKTGMSAVKLLLERHASVLAVDAKEAALLAAAMEQLSGLTFDTHFGSLPEALLEGVELIVLSPGVPRNIPLVLAAFRQGIELIGDVELAFRLMPNAFAGITGTDGKSTTTAMVGAVLKQSGAGIIAGNIGIPVLDLVGHTDPALTVVLELSSFQLESIDAFHPGVAALLNIAPDHLDRYADMQEYSRAKFRLFKNMGAGDTVVLPAEADFLDALIPGLSSEVEILSFGTAATASVRVVDRAVLCRGERIELSVVGQHNLVNAAAAAAVCLALGIDTAHIRSGLGSFPGLQHRFEYAGTVNGIVFINDSKATTITAVQTAVDSAEEGACILLGGRDKGLDFSTLQKSIAAKRLAVFAFGEAREKIHGELQGGVVQYPSMEQAVRAAYDTARYDARPQVILAPGCTSYDEFGNFEQRGDFFKNLVLNFQQGGVSD